MKSVFLLLAIALTVLVYIFLRFIINRISLWAALKRFAKKHNFRCKVDLLCLFPRNKTSRFVQIETGSTVYAIKLFGLLRKHCEIHFWSQQEYAVEWYFSRYGLINEPYIGQTNKKRRRELGSWDCSIATGKEVVPVLLIAPANAPVRLTHTDGNCCEHLRAGDRIDGVLFADRDYLFRYIVGQEK